MHTMTSRLTLHRASAASTPHVDAGAREVWRCYLFAAAFPSDCISSSRRRRAPPIIVLASRSVRGVYNIARSLLFCFFWAKLP